MKKALTITVIITLFATITKGQLVFNSDTIRRKIEIDSLNRMLAISKEDTNRVNMLVELNGIYIRTNPLLSLTYDKQGLALARKLKFKRGEATCLRFIGVLLTWQGRYPEAIQFILNSLKIAEEINDPNEIKANTMDIGEIYRFQRNFSKGKQYLLQALKMSEPDPSVKLSLK